MMSNNKQTQKPAGPKTLIHTEWRDLILYFPDAVSKTTGISRDAIWSVGNALATRGEFKDGTGVRTTKRGLADITGKHPQTIKKVTDLFEALGILEAYESHKNKNGGSESKVWRFRKTAEVKMILDKNHRNRSFCPSSWTGVYLQEQMDALKSVSQITSPVSQITSPVSQITSPVSQITSPELVQATTGLQVPSGTNNGSKEFSPDPIGACPTGAPGAEEENDLDSFLDQLAPSDTPSVVKPAPLVQDDLFNLDTEDLFNLDDEKESEVDALDYFNSLAEAPSWRRA